VEVIRRYIYGGIFDEYDGCNGAKMGRARVREMGWWEAGRV